MGTKERRLREAAFRRTAILDAARELFWQQGFSQTTIPQIAGKAELAPGTLYLYFPSKDALYVDLLSEGFDLLKTRLIESLAPTDEPLDRARAMLAAFFNFAGDHPEYFDIMFFVLQRENEAGWEDNFPPQLIHRLYCQEAECKELAGSAIHDLLPGLDPVEAGSLTDAVWSMMTGVIFYFKNKPAFVNVSAWSQQLVLLALERQIDLNKTRV